MYYPRAACEFHYQNPVWEGWWTRKGQRSSTPKETMLTVGCERIVEVEILTYTVEVTTLPGNRLKYQQTPA